MVEKMEELQKENSGTIILVKNGIFFVAIGKDALTLHNELGLKLTCMRSELCKVGFLVKNAEEYIKKLENIGYSFKLYIKNGKNELEEIYSYTGKNTTEIKECIDCTKCENKKDSEKEILARIKELGKTKQNKKY